MSTDKKRDELTQKLVLQLEGCKNGLKHDWRATYWQEEIDQFVYSAYSPKKIPTHSTTKFEMSCHCGAHITFNQGKYLR